jgi:hypothetical protein
MIEGLIPVMLFWPHEGGTDISVAVLANEGRTDTNDAVLTMHEGGADASDDVLAT